MQTSANFFLAVKQEPGFAVDNRNNNSTAAKHNSKEKSFYAVSQSNRQLRESCQSAPVDVPETTGETRGRLAKTG